jgi:hypothetical protein
VPHEQLPGCVEGFHTVALDAHYYRKAPTRPIRELHHPTRADSRQGADFLGNDRDDKIEAGLASRYGNRAEGLLSAY